MIYIDVQVPVLDRRFEFRCDETVPAGDVLRDMCAALTVKSGDQRMRGDGQKYPGFWLCDKKGGCIISLEKSLREQNIINGSLLILI